MPSSTDERIQPALHALRRPTTRARQSDAAGWAQACDDGSEAAIAIRELVGTT